MERYGFAFVLCLIAVLGGGYWLFYAGGTVAVAAFMAGFGFGTIFAIGSIGFWLLLSAAFLLFLAWDAWDSGLGASMTLIIVIALLHLFGDFRLLPWLARNWLLVIIGGIIYIAIGGWGWGGFMLRRKVKDEQEQYAAALASYLKNCGVAKLEELSIVQKQTWQKHRENGQYNSRHFRVDAKPLDYLSDITYWIFFWPFSASWYLLKDFARELKDRIVKFFATYYQAIIDSVWRDTPGDFSKELEEDAKQHKLGHEPGDLDEMPGLESKRRGSRGSGFGIVE